MERSASLLCGFTFDPLSTFRQRRYLPDIPKYDARHSLSAASSIAIDHPNKANLGPTTQLTRPKRASMVATAAEPTNKICDRPLLIERANLKTHCTGWTYRDLDQDGKPADGFVYVKHYSGCHCPKSAPLDVILNYAKMLVDGNEIKETDIGRLILLIKIGLSERLNAVKIEQSELPIPPGIPPELYDDVTYHECGEWCLVESQAVEDPWQAILLPVKAKEPPGDVVFVWGAQAKAGKRTQKCPHYFEGYSVGPFEVLTVFQDSCSIDLPVGLRIFPVVHKFFLKRYIQGPGAPRPREPQQMSLRGSEKKIVRDASVRHMLQTQRKRISGIEVKKDIYYLVRVKSSKPLWVHSCWLEDSLDELDRFYAWNRSEAMPTFYAEYLESEKKNKKGRRLLPWSRKQGE
ncbi:Uu.00g026490.m01.CDS01 [Anthostomella pinea]|uniref:Uu.00g026490.m01.CDS01 n=1 Tax=Anthostomella pinea TaxID=933095 RepID=A0AAI8V8J8_9PEZI|nr:Uu.00g026490.m01.CDS01 [Anthostomella pinea]